MENLFKIKTLWEYIINFAKEELTTVVWIVFVTGIILFNPFGLLQYIYMDNLPKLIRRFIGFLFVLSSTLSAITISKRFFLWSKNKIRKIKQKSSDKARMLEIKGLIKEFGNGYNSQDECLNWGNKVLPVIKPYECYNEFKNNLKSVQHLGFRKGIFFSVQEELKQHLLQLVKQLQYNNKNY